MYLQINKKYIKIRLHLAKIAEDVFFIRKTKKKKPNEINFLKNYFVTVSFIFAINGHNIYVLINNNNNYYYLY